MATSPMHQFEIKPIVPLELLGHDITLTNHSLWLLIALASITLFLVGGLTRPALVPGRWQSMVELTFGFIEKLVKDTAADSHHLSLHCSLKFTGHGAGQFYGDQPNCHHRVYGHACFCASGGGGFV
jgi:F0F1-type ATP synthase membrane subunit a